jgi:hypothetical protein
MKSLATLATYAMLVFLQPGQARALSAEEILKKMDAAEYAAKDTIAVITMELEEQDGRTSKRKMKMYQKGADKRLIQFESPADVKGIGFLDIDGKMYVYLPAFHKIRRIAGSVKNENFAGTDFAHDDLSSERFNKRLQATAMRDEGDHFVLETRERDKDSSRYSKLVFKVRKKDLMFDSVEYYDKSGKLWKVFKRSQFKPVGKYMQSYLAEMADLKKKHKTRMIVDSIKCDSGLSDRRFSKRQLKRL